MSKLHSYSTTWLETDSTWTWACVSCGHEKGFHDRMDAEAALAARHVGVSAADDDFGADKRSASASDQDMAAVAI